MVNLYAAAAPSSGTVKSTSNRRSSSCFISTTAALRRARATSNARISTRPHPPRERRRHGLR